MAKKKAQAEERPKKKYVTVNCALLNVRAEPSITATRIKQVSEGTKLEKLAVIDDDWIMVPDGYVMAKFVS